MDLDYGVSGYKEQPMNDGREQSSRKKKLHDLLVTKKSELVAELRKSLGGQRAENVRMTFELAQDDGDKSVEDHERHVRSAIQGNKGDQLDAIEQALEKLAAGTYGTCEECGCEIPLQRLAIQSLASYCVACQEEIDRMAKHDEISNKHNDSSGDTAYDYLPDD
jgi:DnaK suppressor protein